MRALLRHDGAFHTRPRTRTTPDQQVQFPGNKSSGQQSPTSSHVLYPPASATPGRREGRKRDKQRDLSQDRTDPATDVAIDINSPAVHPRATLRRQASTPGEHRRTHSSSALVQLDASASRNESDSDINANKNVDRLALNTYEYLLSNHCFMWPGSLLKQKAIDNANLDEYAILTDKIGRSNIVQVATVNHAFLNGTSSDLVLAALLSTQGVDLERSPRS